MDAIEDQAVPIVCFTLLLGLFILVSLNPMFRDTLRGGVEASMRYVYNKASSMGLSSFSDDEINDAERARHIERFKNTHVGGLYNEGNTCFINSVVQSLASCEAIEKFSQEHKLPDSDNFSAGLADLIMNLNQIHSNAHGYSTSRLMQNIGGDADRWNRLDQEDAQEFFQQLLSTLEKDWKKRQGPDKTSESSSSDEVSVSEAFMDEKKEPQEEKALQLVTPFDGEFAMRVGCLSCGDMEGIRNGVISSVDLSLDSPASMQSDGVTLAALLGNYCELETIPGVECYRCSLIAYKKLIQDRIDALSDSPNDLLKSAFESRIREVDEALAEKVIDEKRYEQLKCNTHRVRSDKTKQTMFAKPAPPVLMIHINRSVFDLRSGYIRKNYAPVQFPIILDMSPYIVDPKDPANFDPATSMRSSDEKTLYTLKAAVVHYGSANFGHYVSFRKFDGFWWRISDDTVNLTTEAQVLGAQGVFMLFYEKIADPSTVKTEYIAETVASIPTAELSTSEASSSATSPVIKESIPTQPWVSDGITGI